MIFHIIPWWEYCRICEACDAMTKVILNQSRLRSHTQKFSLQALGCWDRGHFT